jgi:hypothetical protein
MKNGFFFKACVLSLFFSIPGAVLLADPEELLGDHWIKANSATSEAGDLKVDGDLDLGGGLHIGGSLDFGTTEEATPASAVSWSYSEDGSNYDVQITATRDGARFIWADHQGADIKMVLDANGFLGVGTATPQKTLHLWSPDGNLFRLERAGRNPWDIEQGFAGNGADNHHSLIFRPQTADSYIAVSNSAAASSRAWIYSGDGSAYLMGSLSLGPSASAPVIVLNPNGSNPNITIGGSAVLTQSVAGSLYMPIAPSSLAVGTNNFYVASGGKIGLGTASPTYSLSFGGDSDRAFAMERTSSGHGKNLTISAAAGGPSNDRAGGNLILAAGASTGGVGLGGEIQFQTPLRGTSGNSTLNAMETRMRINTNGAVGIGSGALQGVYWESYGGLDISWGGIPATLVLGADVNLTSRTNNADKVMSIATPNYDITLKPVVSLSMTNTASDNRLKVGQIGTSTYTGPTTISMGTASSRTAASGTEHFRMDSSGNITMNYSAAASTVKVKGTSGNDNLLVVNASTNRVGIGTASPTVPLEVAGAARFNSRVRIAPQGDLSMGSFTSEP